jgi:endo-beta-N-acetylglucosaminidase D
MGKKIKVREDGIYPPAAAMLADMWENEPYNGYVINNLLTNNVIDNPEDDKPTMHYPVAYFDDILKDVVRGIEAMDEAKELGANTMEVSRLHISKSHGLATDIYFY